MSPLILCSALPTDTTMHDSVATMWRDRLQLDAVWCGGESSAVDLGSGVGEFGAMHFCWWCCGMTMYDGGAMDLGRMEIVVW